MNGTPETKPADPGSHYGQLSSGGAWFWNGTGQPGDAWIPNPSYVPQSAPAPEALAAVGTQAFPSWPPPSGGAPVTAWETGPVTNPNPYGSPQPTSISTAPPPPTHPYPSTFYPKKMPTGANGQNQAPPVGWPTWPHSRVCTLPDKASPSVSQIQPPPRMGPAPQSLSWEVGPIAGNPAPSTTFPAGHYIDGLGSVVTPTRVIGGLGN
jgi:hypothetical protein